MNILDLVKELYGDNVKKTAIKGEYASPCPFCDGGCDRFRIWPSARNKKDNTDSGGRFYCRMCGKFGDAINFLMEHEEVKYKEACARLKLPPKDSKTTNALKVDPPKPIPAEDPPMEWQQKATAFSMWAHSQLMRNEEAKQWYLSRGFTVDSLVKYQLGFNYKDHYRTRESWGLHKQLKENGTEKKLWLPAGFTIPYFHLGNVHRVKVRNCDWLKSYNDDKYKALSGNKKSCPIYGDTSLKHAVITESELDALLIQQEFGGIAYSVSLSGADGKIDVETDRLLRKAEVILFAADNDEAGKKAWEKYQSKYPRMKLALPPKGKSAGDYFVAGGNLREWLTATLNEPRPPQRFRRVTSAYLAEKLQ